MYLFVLEGSIMIDGQELGKRDAIGISSTNSFEILATSDARLLVIDIPMN